MIGLRNVGFQFNLRLIWQEVEDDSWSIDLCSCCRPCVRPCCGLCAGCQAKPGDVRKSAHDVCLWKRCIRRTWRNGAEVLKNGWPTNETVLIRMWIRSVNTFCIKIKDDASRAAVRVRLRLYEVEVLNNTEEGERNFWTQDERAFDYPCLLYTSPSPRDPH